MSEPNVTLPEDVERGLERVHAYRCNGDCFSLRATLRRAIEAAMSDAILGNLAFWVPFHKNLVGKMVPCCSEESIRLDDEPRQHNCTMPVMAMRGYGYTEWVRVVCISNPTGAVTPRARARAIREGK